MSQQKAAPKLPTQGDTIHTVCTSNGSPYLNFQNRIMYATFKMVQQMPGGEKMVAFTRILHRSSCDAACSEIPTFQVQPLHPRCDEWCEFPVADRPNAVQQWIEAVERDPTMLQAPWVLMIETDYVFMKPLQAPRAESSTPSWGFPFGYIVPTFQGIEDAMRKLYPEDKGPLSDIPPSGPAPVLLRFGELQRVAPDWERLTKLIEDSPMMVEKLGWVREMYAWSAAVALQKVQLQLPAPPQSPLIAQPPADTALGSAAMFHYTWGTIYRVDGKDIWSFDKRFHTKREEALEVPKQPLPPPFDKDRGVVLQDGQRVTKELNDVMAQMITQINRAVETLPVLSE